MILNAGNYVMSCVCPIGFTSNAGNACCPANSSINVNNNECECNSSYYQAGIALNKTWLCLV